MVLISLTLLLVSCGSQETVEEDQPEEPTERTTRGGVSPTGDYKRTIERPSADTGSGSPTGAAVAGNTNYECTDNSDCAEGEDCIDFSCGTIAELYKTDCETKCNFNEITVSTSDDEEYVLKPGEGSYSYAGALEWKVVSVPDYCAGVDVIVPIRLIKKANSVIVGEEVITLREGDTSGVITHPTIERVSFKTTLEDIEEDC